MKKLAQIVARGRVVDEDALCERILTCTRQLGAGAVILDKVDILESMGSRTLYESTVNPAGIGYVFVYVGSRDGGFPFIWIPGVTSKGLRIRGNRDCICPAVRFGTSSQNGWANIMAT